MKFKIGQVEIEAIDEDVSKAIETGELTLTSDKLIEKTEDMVIYNSKEDFETYTKNIKDEEYKATKVKAKEMAMKTIRDEFGFTFEGYQDEKVFATTIKEKIIEEAKIDPSKQVATLTEDLRVVRENFKNKEIEFSTYKDVQTQKETRTKKDVILSKLIPSEGLVVSSDITLMALKNKGFDVNITESGSNEFTFNGNVIKDESTLAPTDGKDFVLDKLKELQLLSKAEGGGGGGDETGGHKAGSYEAFVKEMQKQNIEQGTKEFSEEMNKRIKDKTLVM